MFFRLNKFSRPNGWLLPIACHKYFESYDTWNYDLAYQQTNLVQTILNFPEHLRPSHTWMCQIKQQFSPTRPRCWQITRTKSNLKMRDDGGRTEAAWCRSPLIPTCMILLGKFKLQYVTVSVSTLFCHFVATLLDRLLLQDFCWIWGRLWIKRWKMIMMT